MANWIVIDKDTLNEASVAALIDACDSAALAVGQPNRTAGIIQGVIDEIRTAIATCPTNLVDSDLTKIPKNLRDLAVDLIIGRLKAAIIQPLTDDEARTVAWRRRQLEAIAACKLMVDQPDTPVTPEVQGGPSVELIRPGWDCEDFKGI